MTGIIETFAFYFRYPFVQNALIVGVAVALCASLLGVVLVLKRFSFIGSSLSNIAFGAAAIATALNISNRMALVLPLTILFAILILRGGTRMRIKGDAVLALLSVSALAAGYLLLNLFPASSNISSDVCTTLFGSTSILTLSSRDVWLSLLLCAVVLIVFVLLYHRIFSVTFDEDFTRASGLRASIYNLIMAVIIAIVVVLAMNLVGSLLITALVVFPALAAMRVCRSFRAVTICSVIFSVVCSLAGLLVSILAGTPVGASIVMIHLLGFLLFMAAGRLIYRR